MKRQIKSHLHEKNAYVTMFIDFYGIKDSYEFPQWDEAKNITNHAERVEYLENALSCDIPEDVRNRFIPHLQLHEFETLLFANSAGFSKVVDGAEMNKILNVLKKFSTPEDINGSPETAPSKRLLSIFNYKKVADSALVMKDVDIDALRKRCPRFDAWVGRLEDALGCGHF